MQNQSNDDEPDGDTYMKEYVRSKMMSSKGNEEHRRRSGQGERAAASYGAKFNPSERLLIIDDEVDLKNDHECQEKEEKYELRVTSVDRYHEC